VADFEAWLVFLILVVNVAGELQRKRTLAASRGFLAAARLSCFVSSVVMLFMDECQCLNDLFVQLCSFAFCWDIGNFLSK